MNTYQRAYLEGLKVSASLVESVLSAAKRHNTDQVPVSIVQELQKALDELIKKAMEPITELEKN